MAACSLSSASNYLNNLLLSRGFLHDGKPIPFSSPTESDVEQTMARIINLVHDLVLRRDKDAEQRESLAANIRSLRAEDNQRLLDLQRLQEKNGDLARDMASAEARQRELRLAVQRAENQAKELKEKALKIKSTLDQVRTKCISDVRKRDVELEKLKGHLAGMQRGKREAAGMKINTMNTALTKKDASSGQDVNSTEWSLEKETNDFLAAIVNETSTENVQLRGLVIKTMETLTDLTGLEEQPDVKMGDDGIRIPGQYRNNRQSASSTDSIVPCELLAAEMSQILSHCRSILKDPSFVPIEEVHIREEEIVKLRIGWEKMAGRWKQAVTMMDNWRKKVAAGNEPIDVDEFSTLDFDRSIAKLPNGEPVLGQDVELSSFLEYAGSSTDAQTDRLNNSTDTDHLCPPSSHSDLDSDAESDLEIPLEPSPKRLAASPARRGIMLPRPAERSHQPLQPTSGNRDVQPSPAHIKAELGGAQICKPNGVKVEDEDEPAPTKTSAPSRIPHANKKKTATPPLSVSEKLAAVEAQAREAEEERQHGRQEQGQRSRHRSSEKKMGNAALPQKRKMKPPLERKSARSRRRSTLSPEELAELMGVRQ